MMKRLLTLALLLALAAPRPAFALRKSQETGDPAEIADALHAGLEEHGAPPESVRNLPAADSPAVVPRLWGDEASAALTILERRLKDQQITLQREPIVATVLADPALWRQLARWARGASRDWAAVAATLRAGQPIPIEWGLALIPIGMGTARLAIPSVDPDKPPHPVYAALAQAVFGPNSPIGTLQLRIGPDSQWLSNHGADGLLTFLQDRDLLMDLRVARDDPTARRQLAWLLEPRVLCRLIPAGRPLGSRETPAQLAYPGQNSLTQFRGYSIPNASHGAGRRQIAHFDSAPDWYQRPVAFSTVEDFLQAHPAAAEAVADRGINRDHPHMVWAFPPAQLLSPAGRARITVYWSSAWPALEPDLEQIIRERLGRSILFTLVGDAEYEVSRAYEEPALLIRLSTAETPVPPWFPGAVVTLSRSEQLREIDPDHLIAAALWEPLRGRVSARVVTWVEDGERRLAAFV